MLAGRGEDMPDAVRKLERPRTAGRKPPKVTSKVNISSDEPGCTQGVAPPALITDGAKDEDDDDMFEEASNVKVINVKAEEGEHHGKLVREILEEQKKEEEKEKELKKMKADEEKEEEGG